MFIPLALITLTVPNRALHNSALLSTLNYIIHLQVFDETVDLSCLQHHATLQKLQHPWPRVSPVYGNSADYSG